jgi:hypothetical protein
MLKMPFLHGISIMLYQGVILYHIVFGYIRKRIKGVIEESNERDKIENDKGLKTTNDIFP